MINVYQESVAWIPAYQTYFGKYLNNIELHYKLHICQGFALDQRVTV